MEKAHRTGFLPGLDTFWFYLFIYFSAGKSKICSRYQHPPQWGLSRGCVSMKNKQINKFFLKRTLLQLMRTAKERGGIAIWQINHISIITNQKWHQYESKVRQFIGMGDEHNHIKLLIVYLKNDRTKWHKKYCLWITNYHMSAKFNTI